MHTHARILFLVGPRGSGKSTLGRLAAKALDRPFFDTDDIVTDATGCSIAAIVHCEGWEGFRARESAALVEALARAEHEGAVIATGGGMVLREENRERMRVAGTVFYLAASPACLHARLEKHANAAQRPSLTGEDPLAEIARVLEEREPLYTQTAHHRIDSSLPREVAVEAILSVVDE